MDILERIIAHKQIETEARKSKVSVKELEASEHFNREVFSLKKSLANSDFGIIAEFKRRSPSKGLINGKAQPSDITQGYISAGASAVSVLTDQEFFGGNMDDLKAVRKVLSSPVLRKDFTIDEYHLLEAKSIGADAILLIAAALAPQKLKVLAKFAKNIGLEVLMEVHNIQELEESLNDDVDVVGINNRNLKTFEVSIDTSIEVGKAIPDSFLKISESGISNCESIFELQKHGFQGFLIGENFMKNADPKSAAKSFFQELKNK
ncbi:MAG: indole-3-glycerol phosphate synthase TrpC [Flammeovirgaceae bacterium]|nr:indole-3-glycerol phosphate synthase TrpC [Flammeovirgaceae bacterium]